LIRIETLPNGLTVLIQSMPWLRTAALTLNVRGGLQPEPENRSGLSGLVCEMVQRGAADLSSRDIVALQDNLGIDRNSGVSTAMASFGAAMPAESLQQAIRLYADIVRNPHLPEDQLNDARMMSIQELRALSDEPTHRVMRRLRELHYGNRLGRSVHGNEAGLAAITQEDVKSFCQSNYHAGGAILAIAGNVDHDVVMNWVNEAFGDWKSRHFDSLDDPSGKTASEHIESPSSQTHIGFAFESIPYGHKDYFKMRAGIGILSDGMSSRLFDRVREQRGLCYTVTASCHSLPHCGGVFGYAGTTPERAQETLDVTLHEIQHLVDDLEPGELERWKVRIESGLIMEQESSRSRASSLASDHLQIGRVMTTREIETEIESLTLEQIRDYWKAHQPEQFRIVTLGPRELKTNL
jgi:predicted Zn-dependent peptidase